MSAGVPLYLVSACGSAEEFVAAFRRYADRTGLFVPTNEPLPAGRRGRIALALKNGGVMIDGEAEVVASSQRPSGIHARVGMTLKWVEPDEPSKTVIAELEKARLAMKPAPPSVPARPVEIPAEPRPTPPAIGGRIDAANALAECVVIGDTAAFTANAPAIEETRTGLGKFVIPSIPAAGRSAKPPTMPPALTRPRTPSAQVPVIKPITPPVGVVAKPKPEPEPDVAPILATPVGGVPAPKPTTPATGVPEPKPTTPAAGVPEPKPTTPAAGVPEPKPTTPAAGVPEPKPTALGAAVPVAKPPTPPVGVRLDAKPPTPPVGVAAANDDDDPAAILPTPSGGVPGPQPTAASSGGGPAPQPTASSSGSVRAETTLGVAPLARPPKSDDGVPTRATRIGFPALKLPAMEAPAVIVAAPPTDAEPPRSNTPFMRATPPQPMAAVAAPRPAGPPMPRQPTPFTPLPIVRLPASDVLLDPEKTDLTDIPAPSDEPRSLGVAIVTAVAREASEPTRQEPPLVVADIEPEPVEQAAATRSGGMRASELMAAIGEDWTMTPDAVAPTMLPTRTVETMDSVRPTVPMDALEKAPADAEPSGPAGDWTMSADPNAADGWTPPAKIEVPPPVAPKGNRVMAVASAEPLNAVEWEDKPTGIGEPLVEIDPTLMPVRMPTAPPIMIASGPGIPPPLAPMPPSMTPPLSALTGPFQPMSMFPPGVIPTPPPGGLRASEQMVAFEADPMGMFGGPVPPGPMESTSLLAPAKRRRGPVVGLAAIVLLAGGAAVAVFGFGIGRGGGGGNAITPSGSAVQPIVAQPGSAELGSAMVAPEVPGDAAPVAALCKLDVTSTPLGAEIWLDENQLGVTPASIELPCAVEAKLQFKKAKIATLVRAVMPGTDTSVSVKLAATAVAAVSLRVTSNPPGATITMAGKVLGITPTTIHLPANGASLTLTKDGYSPDTERVTPKPNATHNVVLKHAAIKQRTH